MSEQIDRAGYFRGTVEEHAVSTTKNGYPQLTLKLRANEFYDEEEKEWADWSELDQTIIAYLVLFSGKEEPTFHVDAIQNVLGWDGKSFAGLEDLELEGKEIQWQVKMDTYEGNEVYKVSMINEYDAVPSGVRKLGAEELKDLDKQFAGLLNKTKKTKPASKKGKPAKKEKSTPPPPKSKKASKEKDTPKNKKASKEDKCTREEAWQAAVEANQDEELGADLADDALQELWIDTIEDVVDDKDEDEITPEEWGQVKEELKNRIYKF